MIADSIVNALLQVLVFALVPFVVFLIRKKTAKGFFKYIGLTRPTAKGCLMALLLAFLVAGPVLLLSYYHSDFREIMTSPTSMIGKFKAMGFGASAFLMIVIEAGIKTSLSEEIFFRGFVAKRLIAVCGFQTGNVLQAVIFGAIHSLLFTTITTNALFLFVIFFFPTLAAYLKTFINEKLSNGSIIPGWIAHGTGNIIAYSAGAVFF